MRVLLGCALFVILTVAVVVVMTIFGVGAFQRIAEVSEAAALNGIAPASDTARALDQEWSTDLEGALQTLVARPGGDLLVLRSLGGGYILGGDGTLLETTEWPEKSYLAHADPVGSFPGVLVSSALTRWRWSYQGYEAIREYLIALDQSGREMWRLDRDPEEVSRIDSYFGDFDGDGATELACPFKNTIAIVDLDGNARALLPHRVVSSRFDVADVNRDGADDLVWCDTAGKCTVLHLNSETSTEVDFGGRVDQILTASGDGPPAILLRGRDSSREGMPDVVRVYQFSGELLFEDEFAPHTQGIARKTVLRADLDGDGAESWIVTDGDGAIRLYSHDGQRSALHYTGSRLKDVIRLRREIGDLLVAATHRGATAWAALPGRPGF